VNPNLDFTQTSQRGVGRSSQRLENEFGPLVLPVASKGGRVEAFILAPPPKTSHWELASKNQNIQNLNHSRYRQNRNLRFGKPDCPIFPGLVSCVVYEAVVFHSSHLGF
jgi:hypothetical protein